MLELADSGSSPWMVFEYMPHGDLAEVLRCNSRQFWKPIPGLAPLNKVTSHVAGSTLFYIPKEKL